MYGKIFESCFEGSMVGAGPCVFAVWAFTISKTFDSLVEINPRLLAAVIGAPVEEIEKAISYLSSPDPESRNKEHEGRRLIHQHAFTYFVPSWEKYDAIRNQEERRVYMRQYMKDYRKEKITKVNGKKKLAMLAPSATDAATATEEKNPLPPVPVLVSAEPSPIPDSLNTPEFVLAWEEWIKYKKQKRQKLTTITINRQLSMLSRFPVTEAVAMIDQAMEKGWTGIFPIVGKTSPPSPSRSAINAQISAGKINGF